MRIINILLYKVHGIPHRFRGKHGKVKEPTIKELIQFRRDLEREEQNMLILRHPYLTSEQSHCHMVEFKKQRTIDFFNKKREIKNAKFNKEIRIADRLKHLIVTEAWD